MPLADVPDAGVRPTSSRVREALFSMIGQSLHGVTVLDAFGGSGLLGLEAWSRGARVTIIERSRIACRAIERNAARVGATVHLRRGDALALAATLEPFDIVLLDPPYALAPQPVLNALAPLVIDTLVFELDATRETPGTESLMLSRRREYGDTSLCVYLRRSHDGSG